MLHRPSLLRLVANFWDRHIIAPPFTLKSCLFLLRQSHMLHHVDIFAKQLAWTESLSNNSEKAGDVFHV